MARLVVTSWSFILAGFLVLITSHHVKAMPPIPPSCTKSCPSSEECIISPHQPVCAYGQTCAKKEQCVPKNRCGQGCSSEACTYIETKCNSNGCTDEYKCLDNPPCITRLPLPCDLSCPSNTVCEYNFNDCNPTDSGCDPSLYKQCSVPIPVFSPSSNCPQASYGYFQCGNECAAECRNDQSCSAGWICCYTNCEYPVCVYNNNNNPYGPRFF